MCGQIIYVECCKVSACAVCIIVLVLVLYCVQYGMACEIGCTIPCAIWHARMECHTHTRVSVYTIVSQNIEYYCFPLGRSNRSYLIDLSPGPYWLYIYIYRYSVKMTNKCQKLNILLNENIKRGPE